MRLQLRAAHAAGQKTAGLDMYNGKIADMKDLGVREAYKSKLKVLRLPTCERLPYAEHNDQQCRQALINFPLSPKIRHWL